MPRGRHEKKKKEEPEHVHSWVFVAYDPSMSRNLWRCTVRCEDGGRRQAEWWLEPGTDPNKD